MRIISGSFKGKKIIQPQDQTTRPLKDLVKESIFNILNHSNKFEFNIEEAKILDLFSGVGSFGIECLSRKAKYLTFVENYPLTVNILKKNLFNLGDIKNYEIIERDIYKNNCLENLRYKYDLIFIDPPYAQKNINIIFEFIYKNKTLKKNGIMIIHRNKKKIDDFPNFLEIIEKKTYGISEITFFKLV